MCKVCVPMWAVKIFMQSQTFIFHDW